MFGARIRATSVPERADIGVFSGRSRTMRVVAKLDRSRLTPARDDLLSSRSGFESLKMRYDLHKQLAAQSPAER